LSNLDKESSSSLEHLKLKSVDGYAVYGLDGRPNDLDLLSKSEDVVGCKKVGLLYGFGEED